MSQNTGVDWSYPPQFEVHVFNLALGYFLSYLPYALLAKALSSGIVPGVDGPVGGLVLLPAAALGQLLVMPIFLGVSGWWRFASEQRIGGRRRLWPGRDTVVAALFMAVVIGTTTLNFTFIGVSILFMLLLMRAGVLILSPIVDVVHGRKIYAYSLVAVGCTLAAVGISLGDVNNYHLPALGVLSLCAYFAGYVGRFRIMSRVAKTGVREVDRRYFVEEHALAAVWLPVLCAVGAVFEPDLRVGFTTFLATRGALYAAGIGVLYEVLFIFGTLIYLDVRGYTWCVPVNRVSTLFSGMAASYILVVTGGLAAPGSAQLIAVAFIVGAVFALSYPALRDGLRGTTRPAERMVLFVDGGSQSRSAMAKFIARAAMATARSGHRVTMASAGVKVPTPGTPMTEAAYTVLHEAGAIPHRHRSRPLTAELCRRADTIYCMTDEHRAAVLALAPDVADRTHCLAESDIPEPAASLDDHRHTVVLLQEAVRKRLAEQFP